MSKYQALIDALASHDHMVANGHRQAYAASVAFSDSSDQVEAIRSLLADLERAEKALSELLACGGVIADAEDHELRAAIQDQGAEQIVKVQAVAVLNARAALSQLKGVQ